MTLGRNDKLSQNFRRDSLKKDKIFEVRYIWVDNVKIGFQGKRLDIVDWLRICVIVEFFWVSSDSHKI